jgi:sugar phosphate isomerase/epimerase
MDVIAGETDPALVRFCLDVYWLHHAGEDPAAFIRRHADRGGYFHFKDGVRREDGTPQFRELGAGAVDLHAAFEAAAEAGADWIVYEQDRSDVSPEESVRRSRAFMRDALGL